MNPEEKPAEKSPLHSLRTYAGDVEESLAKNKTSLTSIVIDEQKRRESRPETPEDRERKQKVNTFLAVLGGTLLLTGLVIVWAVYYARSQNQTVVVAKTKTLIAFSEEKKILLGTANRDQFVGKLITEKQSFKSPVNSVLYINMTNASSTPIAAGEVLSLLAPRMPPSLSRSFDSGYMLGIYSFDTNAPFVLLSTDDYAASFAGMLAWEDDSVNDIGPWFGIAPNFGTSTPQFQDEALRNKDLRVLKDANGNTVLLYSFLDKNTLLITVNENIFSAIFGKYLIQKATP